MAAGIYHVWYNAVRYICMLPVPAVFKITERFHLRRHRAVWYDAARNARLRAHSIPTRRFVSLTILLDCVFVGLGGLVGSVLRYLFSLVPLRHASGFPLVTLGINVLGAFLIGLIMAVAGRHAALSPRVLLFLKVGVCGGFTTFSTFALEAHGLLNGGKPAAALLYALLSVILCVLAIFGANALAK